MRVKILFFGEASELAQKTEDFIDFPENQDEITYEIAKMRIFEKFKNLRKIENICILAVDEKYSSPGEMLKLHQFSEIAIIPPISGG
ncbi:unnamed protein product [Caenorhabditis angaria]|uniref:Molybdopterin synthase sulfur carrier subunit n=1 Tax=Caenorhabditis angaria TaxID=860376 RepID=A0A9P1IKS8_9PELO|nr:unnamed protein product [Caenorhabditis angaria]